MFLTEQELKRYGRQMMMDAWGAPIQEKLKQATIFIAGAGGLGSPASIYLAVAGVGHIRLCDFDSPDLSNLNRQILHDQTRLGINKAMSGKMTLERLNPDIHVDVIATKIEKDNVVSLLKGSSLVLDCMDNFPTRYLLDEAARELGIPLVHAAVRGMEGRVTSIFHPKTPCLRCLVSEAPPKEIFPIVGATAGLIGSLQALEAIKILTGVGEPLYNRFLVWDGMTMDFSTYRFQKDPLCPSCGPVHVHAG